jgi:hypothetical protein
VLTRKAEHLTNFTIDRSKINFFARAEKLVNKLQKSERTRKQLREQQLEDIKAKTENLRAVVQQNKHERDLAILERQLELKEKGQ